MPSTIKDTTRDGEKIQSQYRAGDPNVAFRLRVSLSGHKRLLVTVWDDAGFQAPNHRRLDVEALLISEGGKREVIFAKGDTYCAVTQQDTTDGAAAHHLVLSLLAMKPGDTDRDYFANYSERQLDFATRYGEEIGIIADDRYGDR